MRIPKDQWADYRCNKCGRYEFDFMSKGNQLGIFCTSCGRWLKWADKDEQNLHELKAKGGRK